MTHIEDTTIAKQYNARKLVSSVIGTALSFLFLVILLSLGYTEMIADLSTSITSSSSGAMLIFFGIIGVLNGILTFPLSFYSGYFLEHQFHLSNQTFFQWVWEGVKGMLVSLVIMIPLMLIVYSLLQHFQENWWLPVGILLFVLSIGLSRIAPVVILPLFYTLKPLQHSPLKEKIESLAGSTSMIIKGIYSFNLSKTTKKANAAFTGIGKSKRILLGDTLIEEFTEQEIEVVFAHELGHYVHGHIWKNIVIGTLSVFLGLYLTSLAYSSSLVWFGFFAIDQLSALPLLMLWLGIYSLVTAPLNNFLSRTFEYQADAYAVQRTNNREAFISAMRKLATMNLADTQPHPLVESLMYSHPSIEKRIRAAEGL